METCPRCGAKEFEEHDCGPDSWEDDITYTSLSCNGCGLWYDGWRNRWLVDCESESEEGDAKEFVPPEP